MVTPEDEANDPVGAAMMEALRSIDATLKKLLTLSQSRRAAAPATSAASNVAPDSDLDSKYGDEEVKFKPRDWTGEFTKGQKMSASNPNMLDQLADAFEYFAEKDDAAGERLDNGKPKSLYGRRSAMRARGWAARLRAGWKPKAPAKMVNAKDVRW